MTVTTTTDCLSARGKSYIGVTAHWINSENMKKISVALTCQRLKGSHTFDILACPCESIHDEYHIGGNICKTTTDNGSNFVKAFSVFGIDNVTNTDEIPPSTLRMSLMMRIWCPIKLTRLSSTTSYRIWMKTVEMKSMSFPVIFDVHATHCNS